MKYRKKFKKFLNKKWGFCKKGKWIKKDKQELEWKLGNLTARIRLDRQDIYEKRQHWKKQRNLDKIRRENKGALCECIPCGQSKGQKYGVFGIHTVCEPPTPTCNIAVGHAVDGCYSSRNESCNCLTTVEIMPPSPPPPTCMYADDWNAGNAQARTACNGTCTGPMKCGRYNFCVGIEGNSVYCYGKSSGCMWNQNSCTSDQDCDKFNVSSPKYMDNYKGPDGAACPMTNINASSNDWVLDACLCSEGQSNGQMYADMRISLALQATHPACSSSKALHLVGVQVWRRLQHHSAILRCR